MSGPFSDYDVGQALLAIRTPLLLDLDEDVADRRIARILLRLADRAGDGAPVTLRFTRQSIAELSATTLHIVSRLLASRSRAGILSTGRCQVVVRDLDQLRALAGPD